MTGYNDLTFVLQAAIKATHDASGVAILKRYYAQLISIRNRFKMTSANLELDIVFPWIDSYSDKQINGDIKYELASIMYNIGAIHAEMGALDTRSSEVNMKQSCFHFQCAAWCFENIRDSNEPMAGFKGKDLSRDLINFLIQVMLAQGQECIFEKSIVDKRKPNIIAKVSAQVAEFFNSALVILISGSLNTNENSVQEVVGSKMFKDWKTFVEIKISYYMSVTSFFMSVSCEEKQKPGERITWLQSADEKINESVKHLKNMEDSDKMIKSCLDYMKNMIKDHLEKAKRDNDFVYHEIVPSSDKLTAVKPEALVKGIPFSVADPEVSGIDIFRRLIPIEAHEMASIYSQKKDQILRDVRTKIDHKNEELVEFMSKLNLNSTSVRPKMKSDVPEELLQICAMMSTSKSKEEFTSIKSLLSEVTTANNTIFCRIEKLQQTVKDLKKTPQNIQLDLDLQRMDEKLKKATESDKILKDTLSKVLPDIKTIMKAAFAGPDNLSAILFKGGHERQDSSSSINSNTSFGSIGISETSRDEEIPFDEENLRRLEEVLLKVDEMKAQRSQLESKLINQIQSDDVLNKVLMTSSSADNTTNLDKLFDQELSKFNENLNYLNMNLSAQEKMMKALVTANADYAPTRKALMDFETRRRDTFDRLIQSYQDYSSFMNNIKSGIDFYNRLKDDLNVLETKIKAQVPEKPIVPIVSNIGQSKPTLRDVLASRQASSLPQVNPMMSPVSAPPVQSSAPNSYNSYQSMAPTPAHSAYQIPTPPVSHPVLAPATSYHQVPPPLAAPFSVPSYHPIQQSMAPVSSQYQTSQPSIPVSYTSMPQQPYAPHVQQQPPMPHVSYQPAQTTVTPSYHHQPQTSVPASVPNSNPIQLQYNQPHSAPVSYYEQQAAPYYQQPAPQQQYQNPPQNAYQQPQYLPQQQSAYPVYSGQYHNGQQYNGGHTRQASASSINVMDDPIPENLPCLQPVLMPSSPVANNDLQGGQQSQQT